MEEQAIGHGPRQTYPAGPRYTTGNQVEIRRDGTTLYPDMLSSIRQAEEEVHVEYYIIRGDKVGVRFVRALIDAACRGVDVKVILDGFGAFRYAFPAALVARMREAGVKFVLYNPLRLTMTPTSLAIRDHRKLVVVDNAVAYTGGANIKDYAGKGEVKEYRELRGEVRRHDMQLKLTGPIVDNINLTFRYYWRQLYGEDRFLVSSYRTGDGGGAGVVAKEVPAPFAGTNLIVQEYLRAIRGAEERIRLANSYFLPPDPFLSELYDAVDRGVQVELVVPGVTTIASAKLGMQKICAELVRHGVTVYEYTEGVMHSKLAVVDDSWATAGSFNLDYHSFLRNQELNIVFEDGSVAEKMNELFEDDLRSCRRLTEQSLSRRPSYQKFLSSMLHRIQWAL